MPTATYTPLANLTLGSSAASVTFSSISQSYRDLVLVVTSKTVSTGASCILRFNNDSGSNYYGIDASGNGTSTFSYSYGPSSYIYIGDNPVVNTNNNFNAIMHIMDYATTNKHKTTLGRINNSTYVETAVGRWANTGAITTAVVSVSSDSFAAGSTFALYGIAA